MPTSLKLHDGNLGVKLSGYDSKAQFNDALARVKSVPGRRWDPDSKLWLFPKDPETALRLMASLEAVASTEVAALVHDYSAKTAEQLVTQIGEDGIVASGALSEILFPYQRAFVEWTMTHPHVVLADEMGVGKTTEAIGSWFEARYRVGIDTTPLTAETARRPLLAVCPNPTRKNYARTIEIGPVDRYGKPIYPDWPGVEAQVIDGRNAGIQRAQLNDSSAEAFVVNWEKLRTPLADLLRSVEWGCVIASEAHRAKNRKAQQTRGLFKLDAPMLIAETGTPVMNSPAELWTLLRWGWPETYSERHAGGGYWAFHYSYVDDYPTKYGRQMMGLKNVDGLRFELADKLVRRTKKQVLPDLPEKLEPVVIEVELNAEERKLYQEVETALFVDIATHAESRYAEAVKAAGDGGSLIPRADYIDEVLSELADLPLDRLEGLIPNGAARITKLRQITARAKARGALETVRDAPETPFVIFTWYVEPGIWLRDQLTKDHQAVDFIGGTEDPEPIKDRFQAGELDHVVCTIAKGGTGIDLYRSSHALFADLDWVPSINEQAEDRLHRKGQKNEVTITIFRVPDTVDDQKLAPANRFKKSITTKLWGES